GEKVTPASLTGLPLNITRPFTGAICGPPQPGNSAIATHATANSDRRTDIMISSDDRSPCGRTGLMILVRSQRWAALHVELLDLRAAQSAPEHQELVNAAGEVPDLGFGAKVPGVPVPQFGVAESKRQIKQQFRLRDLVAVDVVDDFATLVVVGN